MPQPPNLETSTQHCRLLSDSTRLRLLRLLEEEALSVAELTQITGLAQSRISTHLGRLRDAGLVADVRRHGRNLYNATQPDDALLQALWLLLRNTLGDELINQDAERAKQVVREREPDQAWADSVAGRMESQYSPGRTWEATTRAVMELVSLGQVLDMASGDGVLAELLADRAGHIDCVDISARVVAAGRKRLAHCPNVHFHAADMHALPFADNSYDTIFLLQALTYTNDPAAVLAEVARVLRRGGILIASTLKRHQHEASVARYDHINMGFGVAALRKLALKAGLDVHSCGVTSRERQPPYFEVITLRAALPA